MDMLRKALSGQDRDNDSSTGILPVSKFYTVLLQIILSFIYVMLLIVV